MRTIRKNFAVPLIPLVLFLSLGLTATVRHCGEGLARFAVAFNSGCGVCDQGTEREHQSKESHEVAVKQKSCCEDQHISFEIGNKFDRLVAQSVADAGLGVFALSAYLPSLKPLKKACYSAGKLPSSGRDLLLMKQTFLI